MEPSRRLHDLRFDIRYAVRVLELQARLFRRLGFFTRGFQLVMSTGGIVALVNGSPWLTGIAAALLALAQMIDFVFSPGERALEAGRQAACYRPLMPAANENSIDAVRLRLEEVVATDDISVMEIVRHQAYNDVAVEMGVDPSHFYRIPRYSPVRLLI